MTSPISVLLIDDSTSMRRIYRVALESLGVNNISEAVEGRQGLDLAMEQKPDLILLDYKMPGLNGYQCLVNLKTYESTKNIPVVMITTMAMRDYVANLIEAGAVGYVVKPFEITTLVEKLRPFVSRP